MKVLISRKDLRDTASGVPKKVLQELQFFNSLGYESYAIAETMNVPMVLEFKGVPVKTLRWPISGYFRRKFYQMQVDRWIKKHSPNLVISHGDILNQDVLYIHNCVHLAHELIEGKPLPKDHEVGQIYGAILTKGKEVVIYPEVNRNKFTVDDTDTIKEEWRKKMGVPAGACLRR